MSLTNDYWSTMLILYAFAALFFGVSYISFKLGEKIIANATMTVGLFLNPLGYDFVVFSVNKLTNDYWVTMLIMYVMASLFFIGFMFCYHINPISIIKKQYYNINKNFNKNGQNI